MKVGKPKSKRVPVRLRHKIEKSSANKQRKARKEAKKNPQWRSRLKKDPGIPNLFPYKDKVLAEIEESKRKKAEEQERRREVARAQREGRKIQAVATEEVDEDLVDPDEEDENEDEEMDVDDSKNPMAALLASAQARAQTYNQDDEDDEDEEEDDEEEEFDGIQDSKKPTQSAKRALPQQALADPIKATSALIARLEATQEGMQQLLAYYQLPPLVTAGSDTNTRFLVDVARKRGRLGRGGIPNLHAAALTVLSDINDERLRLPALEQVPQASKVAKNKSEVQIVSQLAAPFRIEGLFGDTFGDEKEQGMDIES